MIRCVIIEDEPGAVEHLEYMLAATTHEIRVIGKAPSVKKAVEWLRHNQADVIFLDVQLGNETCFEIFDNVQPRAPIIFTTSYDQYAIEAFNLNSIAYLLKPVELQSLQAALDKLAVLNKEKDTELTTRYSSLNKNFQKRFLVQAGNAIKVIPVEQVSYCRVQNGRYLILVTRDKQQYLIENTLEGLEKRLDPERFFRINRQFIVSIDAISSMLSLERGRIRIETSPECKDEMVVAIHRVHSFRGWIDR